MSAIFQAIDESSQLGTQAWSSRSFETLNLIDNHVTPGQRLLHLPCLTPWLQSCERQNFTIVYPDSSPVATVRWEISGCRREGLSPILRGRPLRVWPCSSEYIDNSNWTWFSFFILIFIFAFFIEEVTGIRNRHGRTGKLVWLGCRMWNSREPVKLLCWKKILVA